MELHPLLLVSAAKDGVYLVDPNCKTVQQTAKGDYSGITEWKNETLVVIGNTPSRLMLFDYSGRLLSQWYLEDPDCDLHGVAVVDETFYLVETKTESISNYCFDHGKLRLIKRYQPLPPVEHERHINDLTIIDPKRFILSAAYDRKIYELPFGRPAEPDEIIIRVSAELPHSVVLTEGKEFVYCESGKFNLSYQERPLTAFYGFTRGLAIHNDWYYVGQSKTRHTDRYTHLEIRNYAGVWLYNHQTAEKDFIELPGAGEVYAVQKIPGSY